MERGVLAVDGQQEPPTPRLGGDRELAGGDEALLVCERERDPRLERPERRLDAREPDDGVQHDVGLAPLEERHGVAADLHVLDVVVGSEVVKWRRAGLECAEGEIGVGRDDLHRLAADRAGGPQERDTSHPGKDA